jgi:quercetin dioxygenase-like cupin family protein
MLATPSNVDLPDPIGAIYCEDVTLPQVLPTPEPPRRFRETDKPPLQHFAIGRQLDSSRASTLQVAAVQLDAIPDHKHVEHDETVILFFLQGLGFQRLDDVVNPVQAVQVVHIPAGTVHGFQHQADGQARAVCIFTPGYDGRDKVEVRETRELQAPGPYKKTHIDGDWVEKDKPDEIKLGPGGAPR